MQDYKKYMKKCFRLAKKGEGCVSPNPLVGCVVLDKNGNEISSGYHQKYGEKHAEVMALSGINAEGGTLIVNLEPCSHFGKTPPCVDLIIEKKIKRVVIAMQDVNPEVNGKGIKKLKDAGIEVICGVLEEEAKDLNEIFIKNQKEKAIFVATKIASTLDGKIATKNGSSKWITSAAARKEVKKIRNHYDAILTTSSTILADNPTMQHKVKIVLDRELKTDFSAKIYQDGRIFVVCDKNSPLIFTKQAEITNQREAKHQTQRADIELVAVQTVGDKLDLGSIFKKVYEKGIRSILIEAGGICNGELLQLGLIDKIYQFIAPKIVCDNSAKSCFAGAKVTDISQAKNFDTEKVIRYGGDILLELKRSNKD